MVYMQCFRTVLEVTTEAAEAMRENMEDIRGRR